jgi:hypothetical protein
VKVEGLLASDTLSIRLGVHERVIITLIAAVYRACGGYDPWRSSVAHTETKPFRSQTPFVRGCYTAASRTKCESLPRHRRSARTF